MPTDTEETRKKKQPLGPEKKGGKNGFQAQKSRRTKWNSSNSGVLTSEGAE